jgi:Ran GTPase-activating protein (RanGAP) involved in mRNA processing and transport
MDDIIRRVKSNDPSLTELHLSNKIKTYEGYTKLITALMTNNKVKTLDISANYLGDKMINQLVRLIENNKTLTSLIIIDNLLSDLSGFKIMLEQ